MKRKRKARKKPSRKRRGKSRNGLWIGAAAIVVVIAAGLGFLFLRPTPKDVVTGPPDVLLVTIDAIRADRVGCYGSDTARTPTLDRLAAGGTRFENCIAPAPVSRVSHASILTGLYPFYHGLLGGVDAGLGDAAVTLAEILHDAGYRTAAFVASGGLHARYGYAQGFDTYDGELSATSLTGRTQYGERAARAVTEAALNWLTEVPRASRTFMWVHYTDPQFPYAPPGYRPTGAGENPYDLEIAAVDTQLGRLLGMVEDRDSLTGRITLVVVAGSCGEALFDHGEPTHGLFVYREALHVPLIVSGVADAMPGTSVAAQVSLVDITPSILDWLGIAANRQFSGRSLPTAGGTVEVPIYFATRYPFVEYGWSPLEGVLVGTRKFIAGPAPEYYDLRDDPKEARNRYETSRAEADELARSLADLTSTALGFPRIEPLAVEPDASDPAFRAAAAAAPQETPLADPKSRVAQHRQVLEARAQLADGQTADAISKLRDLLSQDARNRRALGILLKLCDGEATRTEALDVLRQRELAGDAWEAPFDLLIHRRLGTASLDAGQPREAARLLGDAVAADPNDAASHFHLARAMEASIIGDPLEHFQKAAELDPTNIEFTLTATDRLERAGKYEEAMAAYERALKSAPEHPDLLAASSWAMFKIDGDKAMALQRARRALEQKPDEPKYQHALAVTLIWNGQDAEAAALLEKAVADDPDYAVNVLIKYEHQGEFELVGTLYDLLLADHPNNPGILNNSAWSDYSLRRQPERALARAARAVEVSPNVPTFRVTLAAVLIWQNRPAEALEHLQQALRMDSRHASAHYFTGLVLQGNGDTAGAVSSIRRAIELVEESDRPDWFEDAQKRLAELGAAGS